MLLSSDISVYSVLSSSLFFSSSDASSIFASSIVLVIFPLSLGVSRLATSGFPSSGVACVFSALASVQDQRKQGQEQRKKMEDQR
jgi:hypothetical protein